MKKRLRLLGIGVFVLGCAVFMLSACKKEPGVVADGRTSYTLISRIPVTGNFDLVTTIYEYDAADNRVDSNMVVHPEYNKEYTFYPADSVSHVKVKCVSEGNVRWGAKVYRMTSGQNVYLSVGITTEYAFEEPKAK